MSNWIYGFLYKQMNQYLCKFLLDLPTLYYDVNIRFSITLKSWIHIVYYTSFLCKARDAYHYFQLHFLYVIIIIIII